MRKRAQEILKYGGIVFIVAAGILYGFYTIHVRYTYEEIPQTLDFFTSLPGSEQELVRIGDVAVRVDVVQSPEEIRRGLGGRDALQEGTGMLFVFPDTHMREFWMKDMQFAIDIIWIREGRVLGITDRVMPEPGVPDPFLQRYPSHGPVDMVLEVREGWAEMHGISKGMKVRREGI